MTAWKAVVIAISLLPRKNGIDCGCLLVTLHTRRKMFTTIPNYYGMEGSQSHSLSLAESEGFEPSNRINGQHLSRVPLSATQACLHVAHWRNNMASYHRPPDFSNTVCRTRRHTGPDGGSTRRIRVARERDDPRDDQQRDASNFAAPCAPTGQATRGRQRDCDGRSPTGTARPAPSRPGTVR